MSVADDMLDVMRREAADRQAWRDQFMTDFDADLRRVIREEIAAAQAAADESIADFVGSIGGQRD